MSYKHHFYADDTQLYISLSPANFSHSVQKLKNCLNDIQNFMFTNKLKLNPDKTEFILIGLKNNRKQLLPHFPINVLGNQVSPAQSVKNLGVVFDSYFTFSDHVSQVIKSTRAHARDLYRIHPLLDQTCKQSNRSNRKVIDWSQLRCNSNSNRLKFFKCNSNRLKFYLLHLLLSIIFLLQFTLCYFSEGGCRKMIT